MALLVLTAVAIIASGAVSATIAAPPGPATGLAFAASAALLLVALVLAGRVTIALERHRRASRPAPPPLTGSPVLARLTGVRPPR